VCGIGAEFVVLKYRLLFKIKFRGDILHMSDLSNDSCMVRTDKHFCLLRAEHATVGGGRRT